MGDEAPGAAKVEIFGVMYPLRGHDDPERLRELGRTVDERMREAAARAPGADRAGLAVLAALNLADELLRAREQQARDRLECAERVSQLHGRLAGAL